MMAGWYSTNYKQRGVVAVPVLGGAGTPGAYDIVFTVPPEFPSFWDNIRSDVFDVIVTDADNNLLTYKRASFTYATQTLEMAVDNYTVANNDSVVLLYVYWNYSSASDGASVFTPTSAKTGYIYLGTPAGMIVGYQNPLSNASSTPLTSFTKATDESVFVWFQVGPYLARRRSAYQQKKQLESMEYSQVVIHPKTGTSSTLTTDETKVRYLDGWVCAFIEAGTDSTNYTLEMKVTTTLGQVISIRCGIQVRDKIPV